jgi:hypothetical protein
MTGAFFPNLFMAILGLVGLRVTWRFCRPFGGHMHFILWAVLSLLCIALIFGAAKNYLDPAPVASVTVQPVPPGAAESPYLGQKPASSPYAK